TASHGGGHFGDIAHLTGQVGGHRVHGVGEVFPGSCDAEHDSLATELALRTDLARDAGYFGCKRSQLVDHRVDGFLQLQDLAADVHRDLAGKVTVCDRDRHFRDVAHLASEVAGHGVHAVGEIFHVPATPGTAAWPPSLPSVPTSRATRVT